MNRRTPLCCVVCNEACYEVKSVGRKDGKPRKVGRCREGSRQVTLGMLSGSRATVTICSCCSINASNLLAVWRRCTIGPMQDARDDAKHSAMLLRQHRDVPIGVLKVSPHEHLGRPIEAGMMG